LLSRLAKIATEILKKRKRKFFATIGVRTRETAAWQAVTLTTALQKLTTINKKKLHLNQGIMHFGPVFGIVSKNSLSIIKN
jgi:hypothetical protein